jgi:F-type H+-transporting ATPase subunit b
MMKNGGDVRPDRFRGTRTVAVFGLGLGLVLILGAGVAFGSTGAEHGGGGTTGWILTDTFRVMNFVVLAGALFYLLRKPVSKALEGRIEGIREQLATLEAQKLEAEKQLAQYKEKLSRMDQEAESIVAAYIKQGEETKARLIEEAKQTAEKLESQVQRNIDHQFEQAKETLQAEIMEKALKKAETMIKKRISAKDQKRLIEEYLDKVVA